MANGVYEFEISENTLKNIGMVIVIFLAFGFILYLGFFSVNAGVTGNAIVSASKDIQVVKMHVEGSSYIFEPSAVKLGVPVRLEADLSQMPGCSKSIVSSELGIRKTFSSSSAFVEFTPNKTGKFYVACSMNMYQGILEVLESDGTKSNYIQTAPSGGHTCGGSGGGCGCGAA